MNNKGFAITTILYGTLILFLLLFTSLLGILSQYKSNLEKLVENNNGARDIITMKPVELKDINKTIDKRGLYKFIDANGNQCQKYLSIGETPTC